MDIQLIRYRHFHILFTVGVTWRDCIEYFTICADLNPLQTLYRVGFNMCTGSGISFGSRSEDEHVSALSASNLCMA